MSSSVDPGARRSLEQHTFDEWPPALRALFDGTSLASKIGFTASLITCDAGGNLRTSLVGIGELYAPDSRRLAFALWPSSRAARTLASMGQSTMPAGEARRLDQPAEAAACPHGHPPARAALTFVHEGAFYQVQLVVDVLPDASTDEGWETKAEGGGQPGGSLAQFIASIDTGEMQQVGYARLTSGVTFELSGEASEQHAVLDRWRRQIERLRQAAHAWLAVGGSVSP